MEKSYNNIIIKLLAVFLCMLIIAIPMTKPLTAKAEAIAFGSMMIFSIIASVLASLGVEISTDPVARQALVNDFKDFASGLGVLVDDWTAMYNHGILKLSDGMYNTIISFAEQYDNTDDIKLFESEVINTVRQNGNDYNVLSFKNISDFFNYFSNNFNRLNHTFDAQHYSKRCILSFWRTDIVSANINYLDTSLNAYFSLDYQWIPFSFVFNTIPSYDSHGFDRYRYMLFSVGKTLYLYISDSVPSVDNPNVHEALISSANNPLIPFVKGYFHATSSLAIQDKAITGMETTGQDVYINTHATSVSGTDITEAQCDEVITALQNPAIAKGVEIADTGTVVSAQDMAVEASLDATDFPLSPSVEFGTPGLKDVFPFCIPFDLIDIYRNLNATRKAPKFEIAVNKTNFPFLPASIDYDFVVDFSNFNTFATVFRTFELIAFVIALILVTRKLIRG